jgi:YVTN family beta-propeller protein
VTYLSPQALTVVAPKGAGLVDVRVRTAAGTSAKVTADEYFFGVAPVVAAASPAHGPAAGGTTVTITGKDFTGITLVTFGGVPAAKFSLKSATTIVAVTPASAAGPAVVQVANPAGTSAPASPVFNFLAPQTAYVATNSGVVAVSVATGKPAVAIKVAGTAGVATTPDGQTVLVAGTGGVTPISTTTGEAGGTVKTGKLPNALAITPDGATAYVVNSGSGTVTPVSLMTSLPSTPIPVGRDPVAIAITPDGKTAYVANYASGTVTPINLATAKPGTPIKVGKNPAAIAITPDGKTAYVANYASATVTPINLATGKPGTPIKVGKDPAAIAITPDGKTAYVANYGAGTLTLIIITGNPAKTIKIGKNPDAIAITP